MTIYQIATPVQDGSRKGVQLISVCVNKFLSFIDRLYFPEDYEEAAPKKKSFRYQRVNRKARSRQSSYRKKVVT